MNPTTFDPAKLGERSRRAYLAGLEVLEEAGDDFIPWSDVVSAMLEASDLAPKSCSDILRGLEQTGRLERRGNWKGRAGDGREVRFIP